MANVVSALSLTTPSALARPPQLPPVVVGDLRLSIALDAANEFSMLLNLEPQRITLSHWNLIR